MSPPTQTAPGGFHGKLELYSKKLDNLKHAVALFVAHFNFCRVHSAHGGTPAPAAGLIDHVWTIGEMLANEK